MGGRWGEEGVGKDCRLSEGIASGRKSQSRKQAYLLFGKMKGLDGLGVEEEFIAWISSDVGAGIVAGWMGGRDKGTVVVVMDSDGSKRVPTASCLYRSVVFV